MKISETLLGKSIFIFDLFVFIYLYVIFIYILINSFKNSAARGVVYFVLGLHCIQSKLGFIFCIKMAIHVRHWSVIHVFLRTNKALPCTAIQGILIWWKQINPTIQVLCICFNKKRGCTETSVCILQDEKC